MRKAFQKKYNKPTVRVRHNIPGTIGRDDFGASQEAKSDTGVAQKRPGAMVRPIFGPGRRCSRIIVE